MQREVLIDIFEENRKRIIGQRERERENARNYLGTNSYNIKDLDNFGKYFYIKFYFQL